jgi:hypothetical protein
MKKISLIIAIVSLAACHNTSKKVGEAGTEIVTSIREGIDKNLECTLELSPALQAKGLRTGKFIIDHSTLSVYFIFDNDLDAAVTARVVDKYGQEYGRATQTISGKKNEARFYDFVFDKRTDIESKSKIIIE